MARKREVSAAQFHIRYARGAEPPRSGFLFSRFGDFFRGAGGRRPAAARGRGARRARRARGRGSDFLNSTRPLRGAATGFGKIIVPKFFVVFLQRFAKPHPLPAAPTPGAHERNVGYGVKKNCVKILKRKWELPACAEDQVPCKCAVPGNSVLPASPAGHSQGCETTLARSASARKRLAE